MPLKFMSYSVAIFQDLKAKFPSSSALETYLTSPEGGQLRAVNVSDTCKIFRYVKGISDQKIPHTSWFRSVIWDMEKHIPMCIAPPKAESSAPPTGEAPTIVLVQDFLDGTMINVYRSFTNPNQLMVATRTQVGAGGSFYSKKTFREMFNDALVTMRLTEQTLLEMLPPVSEVVPYSFGSFLLQHPEHRVVSRCRSPHLWCVHVGSVGSNGAVTIIEDMTQSRVAPGLHIPLYPMTGFREQSDLDAFFRRLADSKGWFWQGIVLKNGKGARWRIRNPNYLILRALRGSEATSVERFLRLRAESKVNEYLKHYSEDRQLFWDLEQAFRTATKAVFDAYCVVHKSHEKKLADIPKPIQPFVFRLHSHFLEHLKPQNESVRMSNAIELVNNSALYEQKRLFIKDSA